MEQHLVTLKESHGWPEFLAYRNTAIDKPYITKRVPAIHHQLFFPVDKLDNFKDRYIGFDYNDRTFSDVKVQEIDEHVIKSSKGYTFAKNKMFDLHVCCREFINTQKFETRQFLEYPKV